jgi:uncharacterized repeat protein (TIGR03803 family)
MRKILIFLWSIIIAAQAPVFSQSNETTLHNFGGGTDGADPVADLLYPSSSDTVYGTTNKGGGSAACVHGCGTVFSIQSNGSEYTVIYRFAGGDEDGANPQAGLIADASGNLYGTTYNGGTQNLGTLFELSPEPMSGCPAGSHPGDGWCETVLFAFSGPDGSHPLARLILDQLGNLYGTTFEGGTRNKGTVFEFKPTGAEVVLYSFTGPNGANPRAGVVFDASGNLWGTASEGGTSNLGVVFRLIDDGGIGSESFLLSFDGADGENPYGAVTLDSQGDVFGTTKKGGGGCTFTAAGCGVVFELQPSGEGFTESILYSFTGAADGAAPVDDLTLALDSSGFSYLFGTASEAGTIGGTCPSTGCGTAFEVCSPGSFCGGPNNWAESTLFDFAGRNGGRTPLAGMVVFLPVSDEKTPGPMTGGRGQCTSGCMLPVSGGGTSGNGSLDQLSGGGGNPAGEILP